MNNAPDYENNLVFTPKDTNYDILKEYEAHGEPLPSYLDWKALNELERITSLDRINLANQLKKLLNENKKLKDLLEKAMDDVYQISLVDEDSRELLMQIQEVLK